MIASLKKIYLWQEKMQKGNSFEKLENSNQLVSQDDFVLKTFLIERTNFQKGEVVKKSLEIIIIMLAIRQDAKELLEEGITSLFLQNDIRLSTSLPKIVENTSQLGHSYFSRIQVTRVDWKNTLLVVINYQNAQCEFKELFYKMQIRSSLMQDRKNKFS
ncbi:unnamed protein product (macronuclear) [Paramecium tetraurelia]|uniref:COMM domain-containing protein n=1 Tax=Paramecium tetraurelia TaxID=5888 RepID=A0DXQ2_PARTE|nr:uncharacterized protein GSPATT00021443001 [Paramecium tetraurelia]CAK87819.1 unnamed protein product [Paramecium tetraurelia]|eukprot:XP_001455216.1 hypothetical protein (macronuclear) [Paramecium tetraurelia strain d4-2]